MNRDMEVKGIVLRELSCRTCRRAPRAGAARLPPRPTPAGPASFGGSSAPGVHPPEQPESFGRSSAPGVQPRSCQTAGRTASTATSCQLRRRSGGGSRQSTPAGLPLKLRRQSGGSSSVAGRQPEYIRRSSRKASAAVKLPEYNAGAAKLPDGRLRRQPDCRSSFGGSPLVTCRAEN
ncbi:unnamed protein product [Boreogadus saida]